MSFDVEARLSDLERRVNVLDGEHAPHHQETEEQHAGGMPKSKDEVSAERAEKTKKRSKKEKDEQSE